MHMSPTPSTRDPFAGLRGILALWVVFGHLALYQRYGGMYDAGFLTAADFGWFTPLALLHFISVDLFFMLSGFVLALHYGAQFNNATKGRTIDRFYWKRFCRLWPMHIAMVALVGLYHYLNIPHPISSGLEAKIFEHWQWTFFLNLLLMNGWGLIPVASWNEPAWSLSVLFLLSVLFPNLLIILKRIPARPRNYIALGVLLILGFALTRTLVHFTSYSDGTGALLRGIVFFTTGLALCRFVELSPTLKPMDTRPYLLGFLALVIAWCYLYQFPIVLLQLCYAPLLLALYLGTKSLLPARVATFIGDRSFALFLTHYPSLLAFHYLFGARAAAFAAAGLPAKLLALSAVLAWVFLITELAYRLFDRPRLILKA